jgi:ribosomal protein S18 acetylase RimI-like enzyme
MEGQIELEFRKATSDDAAQVSALIGSTWAKFFAYSVTESDLETYLTQTVSEAQIRKEIEDESRYCLLAVRPAQDTSTGEPTTGVKDSTVVGVAQLNFNTTEEGLTTSKPVKLDRLYIQSTEQGGGLAATLLQVAEEEAKKRGCNGLWLGVWENNARAIRFYEKMGFVRRGEHFFWLGESKRRDWTMEKSL